MNEQALSVDEAMERLQVIEEYDAGSGPEPCVHTFRVGNLMLGAHWAVETARAAFEQYGVKEIDGPLDHNLLMRDDTGPVVFETKPIAA